MAAPAPDPLSALRDIHLPPEPAFWPPAPGWWTLVLFAALLAGGLGWWGRQRARRRPQREALAALAALRDALAKGEAPYRIAAASTSVLRRAALSRSPRRQAAGITGRAWIEFLNARGGGLVFTAREAELLAAAPYVPRTDAGDAGALIGLCERWIRAQG